MKNVLKNVLLCIPILAVIMVNSNVYAYGVTNLDESPFSIQVPDIAEAHTYYSFTIDGHKAFCLDPGLKMRSGLKYVIDKNYKVKPLSKQAFNYAEAHPGKRYQMIAQTVIWAVESKGSTNSTMIISWIARMLQYSFDVPINASWDQAKANFNAILKSSMSGTFYRYKKYGSSANYQAIISKYGDTKTPGNPKENEQYCPNDKSINLTSCVNSGTSYSNCVKQLCGGDSDVPTCPNDPSIDLTACVNSGRSYDDCVQSLCYEDENKFCSMEKIGTLATCGGNTESNSGYIKESPSGTCTAKYTKSNYNLSGKYTAFSNSGKYCRMFCLQSFSQTYPGNIARAVNAGRYIVWPNNNITNNQKKINANLSKYPLQLTLNKTCDIYVDNSTLTKDYNGYQKILSSCLYEYIYSENGDEKIGQASSCWEQQDGQQRTKKCKTLSGNIVNVNNYESNVCYFKYNRDSCDSYDTEIKNNKIAYERAKNSYESCVNNLKPSLYCSKNGVQLTYETCQRTAGCSCEMKITGSCSRSEVEAAENALNNIKKSKNRCNVYKSAYEGAKSVIEDINSCASATITNDLGFSADFSSSYNDPTYGGSFTLTESSSSQNCTGCTSNISKLGENPLSINSNNLLSLSASIQNREIEATITKTYDLADNYYYYVDKYTNKSVSSLGALSTNANGQKSYSTIGFSNMPISYDAKVGKDNSNYYYNLSLNVSISGTPFDAELNSQDYTCHYEVTKTTSDCICPSGTESEGTNLNCKIKEYNSKNTEKITCADGQILYCNSKITEEEAKCDPITCPNDPSMDLSFCINSGESYESCSNTYCSGGNGNEDGGGKKYHCPKGTSNEGMDITACVIPMMNKGISEQDAYEYCKDVTCPFKGGVKIIYRTISLSNPFPSFDADSKVNQKGLTVGMFNDTVKGRYPGSNWNSTRVVRSKILNNRGVDGDKVYQKQPLYTFTLNSATIKEIRKYNKSQKNKYADFNLDCKKNSSTACVSSFVHSTTSGLTSGTCAGKLTASNFYSCNS